MISFFSVGFGILVRQEAVGTVRLGVISKSALFLAEIPLNIKKLLNSDLIVDDRFPGIKGFVGRPLDYPAFLLQSRYDGNIHQHVVELVDLTTFKVRHIWNPDIALINSKVDTSKAEFKNLARDRNESRYRTFHPLLNGKGNLIFQSSSNPFRNVKWNVHSVYILLVFFVPVLYV